MNFKIIEGNLSSIKQIGELFNLYGGTYMELGNPGSTKSANQLLIDKSHAVKYHGQSKEDIAEEHLTNRRIVDINEDDQA